MSKVADSFRWPSVLIETPDYFLYFILFGLILFFLVLFKCQGATSRQHLCIWSVHLELIFFNPVLE